MKDLILKFLGDIKKNYRTMILAFILSFGFWIIVSVNVFPMIESNIKGVAIEAQPTDFMTRNNLQITSDISEELVNITIEGKRYEISDLKASDFFASIDLSDVRSTGQYTLPINVTSKNTGRELTISSIQPSSITLSIDRIISKEFPVRAAAPNITIPDGYYLGDLTATPDKITLTGSATVLNQISYVEASSTSGGDLTESRQTSSDINVYGSFGVKMDKEGIQFDTDNITVNIPIYRQKELPLKFTIMNYQSNFDIDSLKFDIQPKSIIVASPDDSINNLSELNIGSIDIVTDIELNKPVYIPIVLPDGYKNLSGNNNARIEWQLEDYGKLDYQIRTDNIDISNKPDNFDVKMITNIIRLTVIGPSDVISSLTPSDFIIRLNLLGISLREGSQDVEVTVQIKGEDQTCWVSGKNKVTIRAEEVT